MKKPALFIMICLLNCGLLFSQVAINTDGTPPASSSMLDVQSTSQGVLIPRITFEQRNAIPNPVEGLMVYCTNCLEYAGGISIFQQGHWRMVNLSCPTPPNPQSGSHVPSLTQITWNWNPVITALGYKWNTTNNYATAIDMGTATSHTETGLTCWTTYTRWVWTYNDCGCSCANQSILTQSTLQIPFSPAPAQGMHDVSTLGTIVWNWSAVTGATGYKWSAINDFATATNMGNSTSKTETGLACNTPYNRYVWAYNNCGFSTATTITQTSSTYPPNTPIPGTHVSWHYQIIWNWNSVPGATGYKWSNTNNYATATDVGTSTTKTETGLTCNTSYASYVWAYNVCGEYSSPVTLDQTTTECCGSSITINHVAGDVAPVNKTVTYGIVTDLPGEPLKCWISSNLGANNQATAVDDASETSAGWYWQFNRMQGYMHDGTTLTPNNTFIVYFEEDMDWQASNDPCNLELGIGWRLPTSTEWTNLDVTGGWTNANEPWNSALKMHMAGYLVAYGTPIDVYLSSRGVQGNYWSSSQTDPYTSFNFYFEGYDWFFGECTLTNSMKTYGYTIRCLKE
jgi:hypothetical protein